MIQSFDPSVESLCTLLRETFSIEIGIQKIAKCKSSADTRWRIVSSLIGKLLRSNMEFPISGLVQQGIGPDWIAFVFPPMMQTFGLLPGETPRCASSPWKARRIPSVVQCAHGPAGLVSLRIAMRTCREPAKSWPVGHYWRICVCGRDSSM